MFKLSRFIIPMILLPVLIVTTQEDPTLMVAPRVDNFAFIENQLLSSSRYTQVDEQNESVLNRFEEDFNLQYTNEQLDLLGYELMLENNQLNLYFEKDSFSLILEDKTTGYMLSSRPEFQGYSETREDNTANRNLMNSGLWIESIRTNNISSSAIKVESLYTIADASYQTNGSQDLANIDWTKPYLLETNSYQRNRVQVTTSNVNASSFTTTINVTNYGFEFDINIILQSNGFSVQFDPTTVQETNDQYRLLGLQFFPYFGSAREDVYPGYVVIPDGVGALVRTNQRFDKTYQSDYFGSDLGYLRTSIADLSLPIYGMIHQVDRIGFYHEIVEGAEHATLLANFWGRNTRYHRITNRYNVRRIFRNIINRAGDGQDVLPEEMVMQPYEGTYQLLKNDQASYVGIAQSYQANLEARQSIRSLEPTQTPMQVAMIIHEQEPTFFGTSRLTMTSMDDVQTIRDRLMEDGIEEQVLVLKGWSDDGLAYRQPYYFNLPDRQGLIDVMEDVNADGQHVYLEQDYLVSSELSSRVQFNRDVARNYSKLKMSYRLNRLDNQPINEYYLYPSIAEQKLANDLDAIQDLGATGFAFPSLGNTLYSYYDDDRFNRTETLNTVTSMAASLSANAMQRPSAYMFPHLNHYLDMPITNSQLDLFTDLVPLVPYVLKGYIPTFTPYLNFNALGKERLLQMIDFAVNPSYLLTEKPSSELRYTYSNKYFTTAYEDFQDDIRDVYAYIASALDHILGAKVLNRSIIQTGVSRVEYDNGVTLYINYRSTPVTVDEITISALDYEVVL
ncbi:MAG: hypothetical protein RL379_475 [Bacillota bacterium]